MFEERRLIDLSELKHLYTLRNKLYQNRIFKLHRNQRAEVKKFKKVDFVDVISCSDRKSMAKETTF